MDGILEVNGHNEKQINTAITKAKKSNKPSLISCKTIIGFGSPNRSGKSIISWRSRDEEIKLVRKKLKWSHEAFHVPKDVLKNEWRKIGEKGIREEKNWLEILNKSKDKVKKEFNKFNNKIYKNELSI